jgi:release factor glutamine methyltransferase
MKKEWTIIDLVKWGTEFFEGKGIESARLNIELLLCDVLKIDRMTIYTQFDKPVAKQELARLKEFVKRRAAREPLQYIIGSQNFCGLDFVVNKSVLIPRPETELLVEKVIDSGKNTKLSTPRILDIGTGSGCIALTLGHNIPNALITAVDYENAALEVARENAKKLQIKNVEFVQSDILKNLLESTPYDIIVSNPPYIDHAEYGQSQPEVLEYEPKSALTEYADGLTYYLSFAEIFKELLTDRGQFFLEIGYGQESDILKLFREAGYSVSSEKDFAGIQRIIYGGM